MYSIRKAEISDAEKIAHLGRRTFIESHGQSASEKSISNFLEKHYTAAALKIELSNPKFIYSVLEIDTKLVGFSKIILNAEHDLIKEKQIVLLDRIYLLEEYHNKKMGLVLFQHNVQHSQTEKQKGMWLHTWVENKKAIQFYQKTGFKIIGSFDYKIDETHANPNHVMYLEY